MTTAKVLMKNSGYSIPQIGLGVYKASPSETLLSVTTALEAGYRHIDTAIAYHNEKEVVEAMDSFLKKSSSVSREDLFYTTKFQPKPDDGYEEAVAAVSKAVEVAKPLGYIDLFLIHSPIAVKGRLGIWKALQDQVEAGNVRSIGVSNYGIHHLKELYAWDGFKIKPSINQVEINPWLHRAELVDYCKSLGIIVEAYSPLTRGRRLDDPELLVLSKKYHVSPAEILVSWSIQAGFVSLPKSVNKERIIANFKAADLKLSKDDFENLGSKTDYYVTNPNWDGPKWP